MDRITYLELPNLGQETGTSHVRLDAIDSGGYGVETSVISLANLDLILRAQGIRP